MQKVNAQKFTKATVSTNLNYVGPLIQESQSDKPNSIKNGTITSLGGGPIEN